MFGSLENHVTINIFKNEIKRMDRKSIIIFVLWLLRERVAFGSLRNHMCNIVSDEKKVM